MKLIAHRGYWEKHDQQNSFIAIFLGLIYSDGVEIDLRLFNGKVIVSHDHILNQKGIVYLKDVLELVRHFPNKKWALNIKEDGLAAFIKKELSHFPNMHYFCFDMSFPETIIYLKFNLNIATRISDLEVENKAISRKSIFYIQDCFKQLKNIPTIYNKKIMIISPELHNRNFNLKSIKNTLRQNNKSNMCFLCTDRIWDLC